MNHDAERSATLLEIAKRETAFGSFERTSSGADFREIAVWSLEQALTAAYEAGREAERRRRTPTRCECPACGREIRIKPLT